MGKSTNGKSKRIRLRKISSEMPKRHSDNRLTRSSISVSDKFDLTISACSLTRSCAHWGTIGGTPSTASSETPCFIVFSDTGLLRLHRRGRGFEPLIAHYHLYNPVKRFVSGVLLVSASNRWESAKSSTGGKPVR